MQNEQLSQSKILKETVAFEKKWLGIKQISFTIGDKVIENYQSAYRPGRVKTAFNVDGVEVLPIFKRKDKSLDLIMIANFRPPIGKFCLEFPAGLVEDANFEENASRQLKEETGYKAERFLKIPEVLTHCDPWKSSEGGYLYVAIINQEDPTHYEKQELQNSQNIRVLTFKMDDDLPENVSKFAEEHKYGINGRAWSIILGLNFHRYL